MRHGVYPAQCLDDWEKLMFTFRSRKKAIIATVLVVPLSAGAAFAYWTAGGSGTGEAETGTSVALEAVQSSVIEDLAPGVAAQTLSGTFLNENDGPAYVSTLTASIVSVTKAANVAGTCDATDYTLANPVITVNAQVLADDTTTWSGPTIAFNNKADTNQDPCKGATVNLAYTIA